MLIIPNIFFILSLTLVSAATCTVASAATAILGVSEDATIDEIKKAFRIRMKEYHPDKHNASDYNWIKEEASRMTKLIQEAYQTLSDPAKRKTYTP